MTHAGGSYAAPKAKPAECIQSTGHSYHSIPAACFLCSSYAIMNAKKAFIEELRYERENK